MNPLIEEINSKYRRIKAISHAQALLRWDLETYMPPKGASARGVASAELSVMEQETYLSIAPLVDRAQELKDLNDVERGIVRVVGRELKYYTAIPPEVVKELSQITSEASVVWRQARRESQFHKFKSYLEKIVELERTIAEKLGYKEHPYDALLDRYEEGFTVKEVDSLYQELLPSSKEIMEKVVAEGRFPSSHELEEVRYDVEEMRGVNVFLTELLGMPKDRFRMDVSTHPFTTGIAVDDVRITTRYEGKDFRATMFSTIHESGHAIYELQLDPKLEYTPVGNAASYAIHESQSRFWENVIGRSAQFLQLIYPELKSRLSFLSRYSLEDLYRYFNMVRPSPIRVDADEVTYNFHTAVRYELEKKLISGDMSVSDVPSAWDDLMEKFLGIRPKNDSEGCLQDGHWSGGSFGYFPSYTLGNVIAAQLKYTFNLEEKVRMGDFNSIKEFLREKVHRWGSIYPPKELLRRATGREYDPSSLIKYLREKYL